MRRIVVLLVDDDALLIRALTRGISTALDVVAADKPEAAKAILDSRNVDVVASDFVMETATGLSLLDWARENHPAVRRVLFSGIIGPQTVTSLIASGRAHAVLCKPFSASELVRTIRLITPA